jgi:glycosyltransferase involved in cell wall biosynthesis
VLPLYELRLRTTRLHRSIALRAAESHEVDVALRALGHMPTARVVTVIATYKRRDLLLRAVASALEQDVDDHAVVVVDDGGGLPALPPDGRLTAVSLTRNLKVAGVTRNVGIRISRSEYLAFLDDDNEWRPDHLPRSLRAHARGAELTYTALERVRRDGSVVDVFSVPFDRRTARDTAFADTSAIVVRRHPRVLFSRTPRYFGEFPGEDWEFAYRLSRRLRTEHLPEPTVRYRLDVGSYWTDWSSVQEVPNAPG